MNRFRPLLLFVGTLVLLAGGLFGGVWFAGHYNNDQGKQANGSSQNLPTQQPPEPTKTTPQPQQSKPDTPRPVQPKSTPKPQQNTAPKSAPTPQPQPTKPQVVATAGPQTTPATGTDAQGLGLTALFITAVVYLALFIRRQRMALKVIR